MLTVDTCLELYEIKSSTGAAERIGRCSCYYSGSCSCYYSGSHLFYRKEDAELKFVPELTSRPLSIQARPGQEVLFPCEASVHQNAIIMEK
jgi:hypothetical protein